MGMERRKFEFTVKHLLSSMEVVHVKDGSQDAQRENTDSTQFLSESLEGCGVRGLKAAL